MSPRSGAAASAAARPGWVPVLLALQACGGPPPAPASARDRLAEEPAAAPRIDPAGVTVQEAFVLSDGEASRARLRQPRDFAFDGAGQLYVLDFEAPDHQQILAFDATGTFAYRFG